VVQWLDLHATVILTVLVQLIGVVWFIANLSQRMSNAERRIDELYNLATQLTAPRGERISKLEEGLRNVEKRLNHSDVKEN